MKINKKIYFGAAVLLLSAAVSFGEIKITVDHNDSSQATAQFKFKNIPSPAASNAATKAKFAIVDGEQDSNSGDLSKLNDGKLPTEEDQPDENFFFSTDSDGGRIQVDLGSAIDIQQVNSYSWHPSTRGPQVYKLYASDGTAEGFNARPEKGKDPEKLGWKLIAKVDTRPKDDEGGGQYGVSISDSDGTIGKYRYLLFECSRTETDDDFGNTFYSEINVIEKNSKAPAPVAGTPGVQVALSSFFNNCGIYKDDVEITEGLDGGGYACSSNLLGSSQIWNGTLFKIGSTSASNVVTATGQTIPLPSGKFSSLRLLATAVNGNQEAQDFTVTYGDKTKESSKQSISDWFTPGSFPGESQVVTMAYRNQSDGTKDEQTYYLYGYSFNLNKTNTVKSVTLPDNDNVKVFALTLVP